MTSPTGAFASIPPAAPPTPVTSPALPSSWVPTDIAAIIAGGLKQPETALLARKDGLDLFYPARLHSLIGESESLKTWVALLAAVQEIRKANRVMMLDYEDSPTSVIGRMLNFGISPADLAEYFIYIKPDQKLKDPDKELIKDLIESQPTKPVTLVIIDGVTEVMSIAGWKVNDQEDVAAFYNEMAKWFAALGPAVVMIDHVTKSKDSRGKDAIGAQHKRAGIDGASYVVTPHRDFGYGKHGESYLTLAKDKNGTVRAAVDDGKVGTFHITSDAATHDIEAWIDLPGTVTIKGIPGVTQATVQAIIDHVKNNKHCTKNAVATGVGGNKAKVIDAIGKLINQGYLIDIGTAGKSQLVCMKELSSDAEEIPGLEDVA